MQFLEELWKIWGENTPKHQTCNNKKEKNYLELEPNYETTHFFAENILAIELKKTQMLWKAYLFLFINIRPK